MPDLFEEKNLKPMLIAENVEPFDNPDWIYELKWDGERCIAYLDPKGGTDLRNKRNIKMLLKVPELSEIHRQVRTPCILDGELMCLVDGKPDFSAIQRRSLMSNGFKIELEAKKHPATFIAFDILSLDGRDLTMQPLIERKKLLQKTVKENGRIAVSRYFEGTGTALFTLAKQQGLEGVVGKRKDSVYIQDKRTKDWKKIKNLLDDDFVVCGYIRKDNRMTSIILGQYDKEGVLRYKGHVTLGVGGKPFQRILEQPRAIHPPLEAPPGHGNEDVVWLAPTLVCTVKFMERTKSGGMRQPVFKGLREDKEPEECIEPKIREK